MTRIARAAAVLATLFVALPAHALDLYGIDLKVGARGGANISLMAEPADADAYRNVPYADYFGVGWNAGVALNFRIFNIGAIEIGWMRSHESANGTIELEDVVDCRRSPTNCPRQELEQEFSFDANHIPIVAQVSLPFGVARPFLSIGADLVISRDNREMTVTSPNPLPSELDANNADNADLLDDWATSARAQAGLAATLDPGASETYVGLIAGLGVNIVLERVELPVEFRMHLYPESGTTLGERGTFPDACTDEACAYVPGTPAPQYNDLWTAQFLVLFGIDYRIF